MITYDELVKKHYILQVKRVDIINTDKPFGAYEGFGIECSAGWGVLLDKLCTDIESELDKDEQIKKEFRIAQIKEKFGGLRFYTYSVSDKIDKLIDDAEERSFTVCETCGEKGELLKIRGWMLTLCPKCGMEKIVIWEKEINASIVKTKATIKILSAIKRTEEGDRELDDAYEWINESKRQLIRISEMKSKL